MKQYVFLDLANTHDVQMSGRSFDLWRRPKKTSSNVCLDQKLTQNTKLIKDIFAVNIRLEIWIGTY